jgi:hypothetical protein
VRLRGDSALRFLLDTILGLLRKKQSRTCSVNAALVPSIEHCYTNSLIVTVKITPIHTLTDGETKKQIG